MIVKFGGSIFDSGAEGIVNAVNCVGAMGAGLAKAFADRYPLMNEDYMSHCSRGWLRPGKIHTYYVNESKQFVLNFPTKDRWKDPSQLKYIEDGMEALVDVVLNLRLTWVAIPALGCGLGGLNWNEVEPIITKHLEDLPKVNWIIFDPQ